MLTNMKKRSALLLSLAVICATVAVAPSASAAASKVPNAGTASPADPHTAPNNESPMTACPMSTAPAAGFTDTTSTDVDCIKMFGITQGATADTYEPAGNIPRWQMALFLHRMFVPTGLAAAGATTVPAFTDTSGLSAEIQAAITAIASHGITVGTTATTFSPDDNVTREQMALFLYRLGLKVNAYDVASNLGTANGVFADGGTPTDIASGSYNFADVTSSSFEAMEAIIAMYNIGATGEACTATTIAANPAACSTTYRPTEDINRLEMATMIKEVLDASQARPAGCTMQNTATLVSGGGAEATSISCRNADFTPQLNITVDEFWQVRNDLSAATLALSVPFNALSGLVNSGGATGVSGSGTVGTIDTGDRITNSMGNVAGTSCAALAGSTCTHWIHTGDSGSLYINGTTATGFAWEGALAATATASTFATTMTSAIDKATLGAACNFGGGGGAAITNVTSQDGECAYQGTTRTITTTYTGATAAAVVDGYTTKYTDKVISYGGGTGNQSVSFNTSYAVSSGGVTTFDVVCSADPLPLTSNAADDGAPAAAEYYEMHEVTVDLGTAALGNGLPLSGATGATDITGGSITGNTDVSCDDVARAYSDGQQALSINQNYATVSTAGTLATATATATDQYGDGIAGVAVTFDTETVSNAALTAQAGPANAQRSTLVTNANGTAALSVVVCDTASVGLSGSVGIWVDDVGGNPEMADIALSAPGAGAVEGSTVYCVTAGSDTVTPTTMKMNQADVAGNDVTVTVAFTLEADDSVADPATGGTYTLGFGADNGCAGATHTTAAIDGNATAGQIKTAIELISCINVVTIAGDGGGATYTGYTIAHTANTGDWPTMTATEVANITKQTAGGNVAVAATQNAGKYGTTFDHIDHDAGQDVILAKRTVAQRTAVGAAVLTTDYTSYSYDDTDVFSLTAAAPGQTLAAWEAGLLADAGAIATDLTIVYRTSALGTQISAFQLG